MRFLERVFGPGKAGSAKPITVHVGCTHAVLFPRWVNAADLGETELVSGFVCALCREEFTAEEGGEIRAEAESRWSSAAAR